jgi:hypothetical protein
MRGQGKQQGQQPRHGVGFPRPRPASNDRKMTARTAIAQAVFCQSIVGSVEQDIQPARHCCHIDRHQSRCALSDGSGNRHFMPPVATQIQAVSV